MDAIPPFAVPAEQAGHTLAAVLRALLPGQSWSQVRTLVAGRRVLVGGEACLDPARRLKEGDAVELRSRPQAAPRDPSRIRVRFFDDHVAVVEKPAGMNTLRHPAERVWSEDRKKLSPTLEDLVPAQFGRGAHPRLRIVHRLDKETSGLVVFARTVAAERGLGRQFHAHTVTRRYLALVSGQSRPETIRSFLVRDRGDGRRGSTEVEGVGKEAITHVEVAEVLPGHTLVRCRLETGRTHQIRIHLAERGKPVCGDKVYRIKVDGGTFDDVSGAKRLMLHATELGFLHPVSGEKMHWDMPMPEDMAQVLDRLRKRRE